MSAAVVFDRVGFAYPGASSKVLRDVELTVPEGTFVLVVGGTGSGKSTLLRTMNGLVPHFSGGRFSGRVLVAGRDTRAHAPRELSDVVGFVPQDPDASFVVDRVEDELAYAMENLGVAPASMRRRVEEVLDLLDIEGLRDRSVRTLSGGERQRVAIAAALTSGARLLVLDEPTSQLDPQGAEDVLAALSRLVHDLGVTVVMAEHRLERVAGFADHALGCVGDGSVVGGSPEDVLGRLGVGPPVARLGRALGWEPAPLTVRDARRFAGALALPPVAPRVPIDTGATLLSARGVGAAYDGNRVLHEVDLDLRVGDVVALIGRNGAGKTTLLRCLAGLHAPARGAVEVGGHAPRPGIDVALCPQAPEALLFQDTVEGEVAVTLEARGGGAPGPFLEMMGIADDARRHPRDLSAGERVLVAVAASAATGAPILLLDEPTRGLDEGAKERLHAFLSAHVRSGAALFATHDVELAARLATRVVMLARGDIVAAGAPQEVLGESAVFSPQTARVLGPEWLTPGDVERALGL